MKLPRPPCQRTTPTLSPMGEKRRKQASPLAKELGKHLRRTREERFLSQRQLAEGVGIEIAQVSRYERGIFLPNVETLVDLARFLQVSVSFLLFGREEAGGSTAAALIEDVTLLERFQRLQKLDRKDREMVVGLIDAIVKSREGERVFARSA